MESRDFLGRYRIEDEAAAGQTALEESRFEEATNHFRSALSRGALSNEEEARIGRCSARLSKSAACIASNSK